MSKNFKRIAEEFSTKRQRAENEADDRRFELERVIEGLREINVRLAESGYEILGAALTGGNVEEKLAVIKAENNALRQKRRELIKAAGYSEDYLEPRFECALCHDTGYVGGNMCSCFKRALVLARIESSGLGQLVRNQSFDSFSFDFYAGQDLESVRRNYNKLKKFAENFTGKGDDNWLLLGNTGLGKTHLSSSVAIEVINKGFDVVYMTASTLFSVFEKQRFGEGSVGDGSDEQIFNADLLIIDDLGTESSNQFTVSCLYNIINTRMISGKSTIINTNLTQAELRQKYTDRIASRLFGEYKPLLFTGKDVRLQKISKKSR